MALLCLAGSPVRNGWDSGNGTSNRPGRQRHSFRDSAACPYGECVASAVTAGETRWNEKRPSPVSLDRKSEAWAHLARAAQPLLNCGLVPRGRWRWRRDFSFHWSDRWGSWNSSPAEHPLFDVVEVGLLHRVMVKSDCFQLQIDFPLRGSALLTRRFPKNPPIFWRFRGTPRKHFQRSKPQTVALISIRRPM